MTQQCNMHTILHKSDGGILIIFGIIYFVIFSPSCITDASKLTTLIS